MLRIKIKTCLESGEVTQSVESLFSRNLDDLNKHRARTASSLQLKKRQIRNQVQTWISSESIPPSVPSAIRGLVETVRSNFLNLLLIALKCFSDERNRLLAEWDRLVESGATSLTKSNICISETCGSDKTMGVVIKHILDLALQSLESSVINSPIPDISADRVTAPERTISEKPTAKRMRRG